MWSGIRSSKGKETMVLKDGRGICWAADGTGPGVGARFVATNRLGPSLLRSGKKRGSSGQGIQGTSHVLDEGGLRGWDPVGRYLPKAMGRVVVGL
jgi:hypothetical protein